MELADRKHLFFKNWVGVDGSTGGDTDYTKRYVRYRNIRIKELR